MDDGVARSGAISIYTTIVLLEYSAIFVMRTDYLISNYASLHVFDICLASQHTGIKPNLVAQILATRFDSFYVMYIYIYI